MCFAFAEKWVVVKFDDDDHMSLLSASEVEDVTTGVSTQEMEMKVGQPCVTPYGSETYKATVVFTSGKWNLCHARSGLIRPNHA